MKFLKMKKFKRISKITSDVLGSYTGVAQNPYEKPEQDPDDL